MTQVVAALTLDPARRPRDLPTALDPLARHIAPFEETSVEIVYPQYGGLTLDRRQASVMMVLDLTGIAKGADETTSTSMTLDVRLRRTKGWQVQEVLIPRAAQRSTQIAAEVQALLTNDRVELPQMARLDLASNRITPQLVEVIEGLSRRWTLAVQVLRTGHPKNVFNTDRLSNHTRGRAVDIWALNGIPVIAHDRSDWKRAMQVAAELGADEVGGPVDLPGTAYFSDAVHQDHLHVGIEEAKSSAR